MRFTPKKTQPFKGGVICQCAHCGDRFGSNNGACSLVCKNCKTKEQRKAMDQANKEVFEQVGLEYHCRFCE